MLISWNWLKEYVRLDMPLDELVERLMLVGLNHEATREVAGDLAIDFEVTSNRPDCLGHIGIAREVSAVFGRPLTIPDVTSAATSQPAERRKPATPAPKAADLTSVTVDSPDLCPRYIARVVQGVKVAASPAWIERRLATVGITPINNVVDITNYVLMECGQPLHAFDFDKLAERRIVVRRARPGEKFTAINQKTYDLTPDMCAIADARRPVAIGGVMGGLDTEVSGRTVNVLVESADFAPLSIRMTSRALALSSESSYRFERGVDPDGVEWASRRACQLMVELAGGRLCEGSVDVRVPPSPRPTIALRFARIARLLGIEVRPDHALNILRSLGLRIVRELPDRAEIEPPTWRRDLEREIDLIEEVGRIHGYETIPENAPLPIVAAPRSHRERAETLVRQVLTAAGFFEAVTYSFTSDTLARLFDAWSPGPPICVEHALRRGDSSLRKSLLPSLLLARRHNESRGNVRADLFEIARVYLPRASDRLPDEALHLGVVTDIDPDSPPDTTLRGLKGVLETLLARLHASARMTAKPSDSPFFAPGHAAELSINGRRIGFLGEVTPQVLDQLDLRHRTVAAEIDLAALEASAQLVPQYRPLAQFPPISRDLAVVLDQSTAWDALAETARSAAGPYLEDLSFLDLYRGKQIPPGKKSIAFTLTYRAPDRTLTHDEVEQFQQAVIAALDTRLAATLRT